MHPALLATGALSAILIVLSVTFDASDPDLWHHLAVGRHIWMHHTIPDVELWTWPKYGSPDVNYAWGFEAMVWPVWQLGGVTGLFIWRWLLTLATFGFGFATARLLGARNLVPAVVAVLCAMLFRSRTLVRPEGVAALLLAAEMAWLAARRSGRRPSPVLLLLIALVWANTHVTHYLFFFLLGAEAIARWLPGRDHDPVEGRRLVGLGLASVAVMLVNPFGWRVLWEPIATWQRFQGELIVQNISELMPIQWSHNWRNGLPLIALGWPLLALLRAARRGPDWAELLLCGGFSGQLVLGQRFVGPLAVVALPYLSRDLVDLMRGRARSPENRRPWLRAAMANVCSLLLAAPELARAQLGMKLSMTTYTPVAACDFIERHDLRGRMYNPYGLGGYLVYRFAEQQGRLPFLSIHLKGDRELRQLYMYALQGPKGWEALDDRFRFDMLLLWQNTFPSDELPLVLDRDSTWARVFSDDVACVYLRRDGPYASLARDSAYLAMPADPRSIAAIEPRVETDSSFRRVLTRELERQIAGSREHTRALFTLAVIADKERRFSDAESLLREAVRIGPERPGFREALGFLALETGEPDRALAWFEAERRVRGTDVGMELRRGQVAQAKGDFAAAVRHYQAELRRHPESAEARDSLQAASNRRPR